MAVKTAMGMDLVTKSRINASVQMALYLMIAVLTKLLIPKLSY